MYKEIKLANFGAMPAIKTIITLSFIVCMWWPVSIYGQQTAPKKYPSAVLVQLRAERNRINALTKAREFKDLEIFKRDVMGVMVAMIKDFKDHFNYCPVYYYIDTNFDAVMERKFDGILLNADLSPAKNIVIKDSSTDYLIVHYGEPMWQSKKNRASNKTKWDATRDQDVGGKPNGRGLIINDNNLRQVYYLYKLDFDFFNFRKRRGKNPYKYESRKFDIEYYPFAAEFNRKLPYRHN